MEVMATFDVKEIGTVIAVRIQSGTLRTGASIVLPDGRFVLAKSIQENKVSKDEALPDMEVGIAVDEPKETFEKGQTLDFSE